MRWITQQNVQIARLASAWLIRRFVDPEAEFSFVPRGTEASSVTDGTPFHLPGAELASRDERGTFEMILDKYGLAERDAALAELGPIVRVADHIHGPVGMRGVPVRDVLPGDAPPEAAGIHALLHGSRLVAANDLDAMERAASALDAVYASLQARRERATAGSA